MGSGSATSHTRRLDSRSQQVHDKSVLLQVLSSHQQNSIHRILQSIRPQRLLRGRVSQGVARKTRLLGQSNNQERKMQLGIDLLGHLAAHTRRGQSIFHATTTHTHRVQVAVRQCGLEERRAHLHASPQILNGNAIRQWPRKH